MQRKYVHTYEVGGKKRELLLYEYLRMYNTSNAAVLVYSDVGLRIYVLTASGVSCKELAWAAEIT